MSSEDLKKLFYKEIEGASKAYFIKTVQDKFPTLTKKDIETWLKAQEVTQINKKVDKGLNLKITAKPRTFQIDIMYFKTGQSLKSFLLLVDIMSRKAFCYPISGNPNMTKIINIYKMFLKEVGHVEAIAGDDEFNTKDFTNLNKELNIRLDTSVAADNHFTHGNKLGIIDRLTRTIKESMQKYRDTVDNRGTLQSMINKIVTMYNDSPHRGLKGKTPNESWVNINEQKDRNREETIYNDRIFNRLDTEIGDAVRVLETKGQFDKGSNKFSKDVYEINERVGYSYKVKDSDGTVKRRRYKPNELQTIENVENTIDRDRIKRDDKNDNKYKTTNKLIRNEEMTRTEARKAVKDATEDVLSIAQRTRSKDKTTRSKTTVDKLLRR
jgi:hypothetical protein